MRKIVINGGRPLQGEITISGAKNSVVALIPAIILADDVVTLDCVPDISDVANLVEIMELMGLLLSVMRMSWRLIQEVFKIFQCLMGRFNSLQHLIISTEVFLGRFGEATVGYLVDVILGLVRLICILRL